MPREPSKTYARKQAKTRAILEMIRNGAEPYDVAHALQVPPNRVYNACSYHKVRCKAETIAKRVRRLFIQDEKWLTHSSKELAQMFKCTANNIRTIKQNYKKELQNECY